jgi:hypothetical protein
VQDSEGKFGRVWYIEEDESDLFDGEFGTLSGETLEQISDAVYEVDATGNAENQGVRLNIETPDDEKEWKNVEITGYFKLLDFSQNEEFSIAARSGHHSDDTICDATGYFGKVGFDGDVAFQKKIFHGSYADSIEKRNDAVEDLEGEWIGIKMVAYNINDDHDVHLELWVDEGDETNDWEKLIEYDDEGDWYADDSGCDRDRNEILNDPRPWVVFRADNAEFQFKNLSVREIDP